MYCILMLDVTFRLDNVVFSRVEARHVESEKLQTRECLPHVDVTCCIKRGWMIGVAHVIGSLTSITSTKPIQVISRARLPIRARPLPEWERVATPPRGKEFFLLKRTSSSSPHKRRWIPGITGPEA